MLPAEPAAGGTETQIVKATILLSYEGKTFSKEVEIEKGANAFAATTRAFPVQYSESSFGKFVTGLDNYLAPKDSYWALYIDGEYSMVGAEQVVLEKDTAIEWKLEKVSFG